MKEYIIFYDDTCGMCNWSVRFFLKQDRKNQFLFAPLSGKTAAIELAEWLQDHPAIDSIVFMEKDLAEKKIYYFSRAILRLLWCLGGLWSCVGCLSFLPSWLLWPGDLLYRFIARHRRNICPALRDRSWQKQYEGRFLD